jgi:uncharacterized damage-inducible protein DinB
MPRSLLADAFEHHSWATLRILDVCASLDDDQLATAVPGTFGSILDTLRHLVGADAGYLFGLTRGAYPEIEEATMGVAELRAAIERNATAWADLLASDPDPDEVVVRHRDDGSGSHAPAGIRLAQVLHHGTDHRSQICTALTSLGIEPPEIDVWDFAWQAGRLHEVEPPSGAA